MKLEEDLNPKIVSRAVLDEEILRLSEKYLYTYDEVQQFYSDFTFAKSFKDKYAQRDGSLKEAVETVLLMNLYLALGLTTPGKSNYSKLYGML